MAYHSENRVYRDKQNAMIGGVCAGLSDYLKLDVSLVRIIMAALVLAWGSGLLFYILLWALLPVKPNQY